MLACLTVTVTATVMYCDDAFNLRENTYNFFFGFLNNCYEVF